MSLKGVQRRLDSLLTALLKQQAPVYRIAQYKCLGDKAIPAFMEGEGTVIRWEYQVPAGVETTLETVHMEAIRAMPATNLAYFRLYYQRASSITEIPIATMISSTTLGFTYLDVTPNCILGPNDKLIAKTEAGVGVGAFNLSQIAAKIVERQIL